MFSAVEVFSKSKPALTTGVPSKYSTDLREFDFQSLSQNEYTSSDCSEYLNLHSVTGLPTPTGETSFK